MNSSRFITGLLLIMVAIIGIHCDSEQRTQHTSGNEILEKINVSRGICVLLDDKKCEVALDLLKKSELVLFVQLSHDADVEIARQIADSVGYYGTRIYVEKNSTGKINLADNIADAVIGPG